MKAVFIDGPSIHHMGHAMGIAQFNLFALNKFLSENVGTEKELATHVVVTVTPDMGKKAEQRWRAADFEVLEVTSAHSADDQAIIDRILALDPEKVKEVVIVSTDQDYITALRQKMRQGLKVFWVGSSIDGPTRTPLMSTSLKPLLGTEFEFIDLVDHKDQLIGLPKKMLPARKIDTPSRTLKIELSGASNEQCAAALSFLVQMIGEHPNITYKIEG